jgi:uncharacterized protein
MVSPPPMVAYNAQMEFSFEWDANKASSNLAKHGVSFVDAATVLQDALALTVFDAEHSSFEDRWFTLGLSISAQLLAVSHTYVQTSASDVKIRLISARPATRQERRSYENEPR